MPQLTPAPWFFILISFWLIFILLSPQKILHHILLSDPLIKPIKTQHPNWTWTWPWL
uniref:ATP synthase complex subunit 8 n=2 Tax=Microhylidae TaxID=8427 RepID=S4V137_9NEOB|nr:ATP synthase F0 subunit 8 [Cophixalus sp. TNHC 54754]AVP25551.1 ATP synthase subunit 8 [Hylophorbus sp. TNHC-GDC 31221]